jgi:TonB family protein
MATPLHSEELGQPKSMQFAHFGVLDAGHQSKPSVFASMLLNLFVALILIVITAANAKMIEKTNLLANVTFQPVPEKVEPVKPKFVPPPPKPILQIVPKVEVQLPRITVVKLPDVPKPPVVKMDEPKPVIAPPAPAKVIVMAAPQVVNLNAKPQAASVVNNDPHPSAVRLGNPNSPVGNMKGPGVASVNLARGMPGMNSANTGNGPPATKIILGNGSPGGTSIKGNSVVAVVGIPHGVPGATGTSQVASQVNLGQVVPPHMPKPAAPVAVVQRTEPKVLYKPKPEYTAEARQLHIEGVVTLHIRVLQNGSVVVLNVINDLGHGLADSAKRAILATKFDPATDTSGQPIIWDGIVNVTFQLAG